jgi:hypothetical protein
VEIILDVITVHLLVMVLIGGVQTTALLAMDLLITKITEPLVEI